MTFDDLLAANRRYADDFTDGGYDGVARAGVAIISCMDSRIDPLRMVGLGPGDAKIFRNPGGRVTPQALEALIICTHMLRVNRILVVPHTRCSMVANTEAGLHAAIGETVGEDITWQPFGVIDDQQRSLEEDVRKVRSHPLIPSTTEVGGFLYDVDTGRLDRRA